jgi:hypothetical protein
VKPLIAQGFLCPRHLAERLFDQQLGAIDQALRQGARAYGFDTDHWTLARIAAVIEQLTGSATILATCGSCCSTGCTGACSALPAAPIERDEQAIDRWVAQDWP